MSEYFENLTFIPLLYALIILLIGHTIARFVSKTINSRLKKHLSAQQIMIICKLSFYGIFIIFIIAALQQVGFQLGVLLGTAGVISVAFAFASRTSMANVVSGLFLIIERPFVIGDLVTIKNITGNVTTIDLMSTKITTTDYTLVRIPNNTVVSSDIINLTHYAIRRVDINLGVAYKTDLNQVRELLINLVENHEHVLKNKETSVNFSAFADSAINLRFSFWAKKEDFYSLQREISEQIKIAFEQNNIEIPYPQLTIHRAE